MGLQCSCCCLKSSPAPKDFHILLLGASGSGKTELGHRLRKTPRPADDQDATNGVRCFEVLPEEFPDIQLQLTEVGGNSEMQRLWHHYFASSHALIYCFDLSQNPEELGVTFRLLRTCLQDPQMSGKPVLLVASRYCDGVQLYDVANAFGLDHLAMSCGCPLLICYMDDPEDLQRGIRWLCHQFAVSESKLEQRVRYDVNMKAWQQRRKLILTAGKLAQIHRQRFRRQHRKLWPANEASSGRPSTAPPNIFFIRPAEAGEHP
ncbi:uncharacterized protein Dana_GF19509 [Drosophila ananassae]|uniref:ADP-ribosylation factor-like protein 15 n=1 Tax=Drosophila ananassae TaxID=7217 RepID=B3MXS0_DROAN|nr:probable ADP-ribosylation factor At2g15310 [Drosophila ananassae]EDV38535.2 uncharacterized protein Dana_GF19509 [Drosophila ananassae]